MRLTSETYREMIKYLKAIYSPDWHPKVNDMDYFFGTCQDKIPEELALYMCHIYCTRHGQGPASVEDILSAFFEAKKEDYEEYLQDLIHSEKPVEANDIAQALGYVSPNGLHHRYPTNRYPTIGGEE